jgi:hypothetical protein
MHNTIYTPTLGNSSRFPLLAGLLHFGKRRVHRWLW